VSFQVILNILANAEDAIVARKIEQGKIDITLKSNKENIIIKIEDNAGGIEKSKIDKIFDIYFTTKNRKEGSGLGLYMSKLIIESKLGGEIKAKNKKVGAQFKIVLPFEKHKN